jgi:3-hydroxyacyl-CoA dehydrogenase
MGAQIGALAAESGFAVVIRYIEEKFIERGRQIINANLDKRIYPAVALLKRENRKSSVASTFMTDLKSAVKDADYIIEAVCRCPFPEAEGLQRGPRNIARRRRFSPPIPPLSASPR